MSEPSKPTIIFFDNDGKNLRDFDSNRHLKSMFNIINILVDDKKPNEFCGEKTEPKSQKVEYMNHFQRFGNSYAQLTESNGEEPVIPSRGITEEQHINLLENIDEIPGEKIAIFDWDRTITVIEGMIKIPHSMIPDMIVYLCGGDERLARLQEMFRELHGKRVEVFILSNNPSADKSNSEETFELFKQLLKILDPNMEEDHIIGCIRKINDKKTKLTKSNAFIERYLSTRPPVKISLPLLQITPVKTSVVPGKITFTSPRSPISPRSSGSSLTPSPRVRVPIPGSPGRVAISSPRSSQTATDDDDDGLIKISYAKNPRKKFGGKKTTKRKTTNNKRTKRKRTKRTTTKKY